MKSYWITYFYVVISSVVISGFRHEVYENCALLSYYAASSGNSFPTFRDNLWTQIQGSRTPKGSSLQGSRTQKGFKMDSGPFKAGQIGCSETPVRNYYCSLHNNPEECSSYKFIVYL